MGRTRAKLTRRQHDVLERIARGETNPEIATALGIGFETVKMHVAHIFTAIDVSSREEAAAWFHANQPVPPRSWWQHGPARIALTGLSIAGVGALAGLVVISLRGGNEAPGSPTAPAVSTSAPYSTPHPDPSPRAIAVAWEYTFDVDGVTLIAADAESVISGHTVRTQPGTGSGVVVSLDATTGAEQWRTDLPCVPFTPAIDAETAYVPCADGSTYALARDSGRQRWRSETNTSPIDPKLANGVLILDSQDPDGSAQLGIDPIFLNQGDLVALDASTGSELWRYRGGLSEVYADVAGDTVYAVTASNTDGATVLAALDLVSGTERWRRPLENGNGAPRIANGLVVVAAEDIQAFDAATGAPRWSVDQYAYEIVIANGVVFGVSGYGQDAAFGLDLATGTRLWAETYCDCPFRPSTDGKIFAIAGGFLVGVLPRSGTSALVLPTNLTVDADWKPALVDDWIYISGGDSLTALR